MIAAHKSNNCPAVVLKRMPFCGSFCIVMGGPPTTSIVSFWQAWHSNVRCSQPVSSDASRVSHIDTPHLGHVGYTMSCNCELGWTSRTTNTRCLAGWACGGYHQMLTHVGNDPSGYTEKQAWLCPQADT